jgi:hypothetical protein
MMLFYLNKNCQKLYKICESCLKLSIDHYSSAVYPELNNMPHLVRNWISIPFPSNIHQNPSSNAIMSYERILHERNYFPKIYQKERTHQFCFIGNIEVTATKQRNLRKKILQFCSSYSQDCYSQQLPSHSSNVPFLSSSSGNRYEHCKMCFIPGGDFPTRKAFFDALLSGCIPIIFQEETAMLQWPYHWQSRQQAEQSVYFYPRDKFMTQTLEENYQQLSTIVTNQTFLLERIQMIAKIGDRLQYDIIQPQWKTVFRQEHEKDAFQVIIDIIANFH